MALEAKENRVFLSLLDDCIGQGRDLFPKNIHTTFSMMPAREGVTKSQFRRAFERLLADGAIRLQEDGPPSKRRKLVQRAIS